MVSASGAIRRTFRNTLSSAAAIAAAAVLAGTGLMLQSPGSAGAHEGDTDPNFYHFCLNTTSNKLLKAKPPWRR